MMRSRVTRRVGSSRARVEPAIRVNDLEEGRAGEFRVSEDPEQRQDPRGCIERAASASSAARASVRSVSMSSHWARARPARTAGLIDFRG